MTCWYEGFWTIRNESLKDTKSSGQYVLRDHHPMQICTSHSWWTGNHPKAHGINSIQLWERWYPLISHLSSQIYKSNKINIEDSNTTSNQQKHISILVENKCKHVRTLPSQQKRYFFSKPLLNFSPPPKKNLQNAQLFGPQNDACPSLYFKLKITNTSSSTKPSAPSLQQSLTVIDSWCSNLVVKNRGSLFHG